MEKTAELQITTGYLQVPKVRTALVTRYWYLDEAKILMGLEMPEWYFVIGDGESASSVEQVTLWGNELGRWRIVPAIFMGIEENDTSYNLLVSFVVAKGMRPAETWRECGLIGPSNILLAHAAFSDLAYDGEDYVGFKWKIRLRGE